MSLLDKAEEILFKNLSQFINQEKTKNELNSIKKELNKYLVRNYEKELYFNDLYRYINNGSIQIDKYDFSFVSAFYFTLICAFFDCDGDFLGEENFSKYHWNNIKKNYPYPRYDKHDVIKCFTFFYNTFKNRFFDINNVSDNERTIIINSAEIINKNIEPLKKNMEEILKILLNQNFNTTNLNTTLKEPLIKRLYDDNEEYQAKYNDTLFLESEVNDDKKATLKDMYIKPHIKSSYVAQEFDLNRWANDIDSRILLLYGKAGIGKTSFVSWLAFEKVFEQESHILELRRYISMINSDSPWESIKQCFKCDNDDIYQNKILILDGLDEVCVLNNQFNGDRFITQLNNTLRTRFGRNIKIIITSRMGYFNEIKTNNNIVVQTIFWSDDTVAKWCNTYSHIHDNRKEWCESFKEAHSILNKKDKRKKVFCTPFVLYICCVSQINIFKHDGIAGIYNEAFNVIGKRQYNELNTECEIDFEINKQFTKEIAFQMFLNKKLEETLESSYVTTAKQKVIKWFQEKYDTDSSTVIEPEFKKLFAMNHFAYNRKDAVEFVHKTVGEYFVAVKLYEDYLENIPNEGIEKTWNNIFNAFRYKKIPIDIMKYLIELLKNNKDDNWKNKFFQSYYEGIEKQLLIKACNLELEYQPTHASLIKQIHIAFRNLTWLLTGIGFDNSEFCNSKHNLEILASYINGDVNLSNWKNLENINLSKLDLSRSNLKGAHLNGSNFSKTNLSNALLSDAFFNFACLEGAVLKWTIMKRIYMEEANLEEAHLEGANLEEAHLEYASLESAHLKYARLSNAHFENAHIEKADLENSHFDEAHLENAHFEESNLKNTYFTKAFLKKAFGYEK